MNYTAASTPDFDAMSDGDLYDWREERGTTGMTERHADRCTRFRKTLGERISAASPYMPNSRKYPNRYRCFDLRGWYQVVVPPGRRALNEETVVSLMKSIEAIGLQSPPAVRLVTMMLEGEEQDNVPVLVYGHHRIEAAKRLGWKWIECLVLDLDDIAAELTEISENLHRAELTVLQRDEQIARWIELTTVKPEISSDDAKPAQVAQVSGGRGNKGGISEASRELGIERTDAIRATKVAALSPEAKAAATDAGLDDNRSALLEAAKETEPEKQVAVIRDWKQEAKRLKDVNKDLRGKIEARDALERVEANLVKTHSARAMFAEADKERLQAEVDRLTEENAALRTAKEDSDARYRELWAFVDKDARDAFMAQISREAA
ncbi:ParB N-terminal domain-containing protein [Bradyrhizobium sp. 61]|uniref:ParB/RepB/Spo0J family partition protein n=1 Tax=unclassified Bradyrhizobium TaxID=2631580 RepID=UPI001FFBC81F|nr:ParB N-terminal domain-containing protein [Bradyrhizobium sp. 61]MCK1445874.1 ParB N-terminal domain-containing protein [Bradyrhizobium sp. 48]MCK1460984.1 ParB N-terminal domain-containing protein [Bradyrhizobium sp. 2]